MNINSNSTHDRSPLIHSDTGRSPFLGSESSTRDTSVGSTGTRPGSESRSASENARDLLLTNLDLSIQAFAAREARRSPGVCLCGCVWLGVYVCVCVWNDLHSNTGRTFRRGQSRYTRKILFETNDYFYIYTLTLKQPLSSLRNSWKRSLSNKKHWGGSLARPVILRPKSLAGSGTRP